MEKYDVVIIGAGPAGLSLAYQLKAAGQKVAVIEENKWGGTCPNRGCDPKKVLLGAVTAKRAAEQLKNKGIAGDLQINWPDLIAFKKNFTDPVSKNSKAGLVAAGIDTYDGSAKFLDQETVDVAGKKIQADKFVLATGQRPSRMNITGGELLQTSTDFLAMTDLPKTIAFIGGGYIAFEFAAIASAAGAKVHIIHHNERPLKEFPQVAVKALIQQLERQGVVFDYNVETSAIETDGEQVKIIAPDFSLKVDRAFVTTGRIPNVEHLALDQVGVDYDRHGIAVDDHLRTNIANIYAMGDVVARKIPKLTPVATFEADYLAQELQGVIAPISYPEIPTVVYGMPKVAQVGISLDAAAASELYQVKEIDMTKWFTYAHLNEPFAKAWVVMTASDQKIVGAVTISNEADELINYLTQIINTGQTEAEIAQMVYLYPTVASDLVYLK